MRKIWGIGGLGTMEDVDYFFLFSLQNVVSMGGRVFGDAIWDARHGCVGRDSFFLLCVGSPGL